MTLDIVVVSVPCMFVEWQIVLNIYPYTVKSNCCGCHKNSFRFSVLIRLLIWYKNSKIYSADLLDSISETVHAGGFWYHFHQLGASILKIIYIYIYIYIIWYWYQWVCVCVHTHTFTDISIRLLLDLQYRCDYIGLTDKLCKNCSIWFRWQKQHNFCSCFCS